MRRNPDVMVDRGCEDAPIQRVWCRLEAELQRDQTSNVVSGCNKIGERFMNVAGTGLIG
jgi:hypothetical protein